MTSTYGGPRDPLLTRPSRTTGSMAEWTSWVDTFTRRDRDKLYPGMHIDLIPAYEVIMGKEESADAEKSGWINSARPPASGQFGMQSSTNSFSVTPVPAPFPSFPTFPPMAPNPLLSNSDPVLPATYTTYDPARYAPKPWAPPQLGAAAQAMPTVGGLLDASFVPPSVSGSQSAFGPRGIAPPPAHTSNGSNDQQYGLFGNAWSGITFLADEAWDVAEKTARKVSREAIRIAKDEVLQTFIDFHSYYDTASDRERANVHKELRTFGISAIPGVSEVTLIIDSFDDGELSLRETVDIAISLILLIFVAIKSVKVAVKFWRWFRKVAKRGARGAARQATRQAARAWSKEQLRDAFAAFAEEFITQAVATRTGYGKWDAADLGISTLSGAASGQIAQNHDEIAQTWAELANAMLTAFFKSNLPIEAHQGGIMEWLAASVRVSGKAAVKATIMGAFSGVFKYIIRKAGVPETLHDDILILLNVVIGKGIDILIDGKFSDG